MVTWPTPDLVDRADGRVAVIGDTGSVAETTTTDLLGRTVALPGNLHNEIGRPATVSRIVLVRGSNAPGRSRWLSR